MNALEAFLVEPLPKKQGITLVAVVLPTRGSVHSDKLDRNQDVFADYDGIRARASYQAFLTELRAAGIHTPDVSREVHRGARFYFKSDQHWKSAGARRVADAVAGIIRPLPAYKVLETTPFSTRSQGKVYQKGWLQERVERRCKVSLGDEVVETFTTELVKENRSIEEALFASSLPAPVALVGTSNSNRESGRPELNFSGFLQQELELEVLNAAFPGAKVYASMLAYLHSDDYLKQKPTFIVWETLSWEWHNRHSLNREHRQVIPSIYGACSLETAKLRASVEPNGEKVFTLLHNEAELPLQGRDYFVYLEIEDKTLVNFELTLSYSEGRQETLRLFHSTRVANSGRFFLELSSSVQGILEDVTLTAYRPVQGEVHARICKAPAQ